MSNAITIVGPIPYLEAICRLSSTVRLPEITILSPTSTASANSTESAAYLEWKTSSSRYPEESLMGCSLSILN